MGNQARRLGPDDMETLGVSEVRLNGEVVVEIWANEETEELAPFIYEWRRDGRSIPKVWATAANAPLPRRIDDRRGVLLAALWLLAASATAVFWFIWNWLS